MAAKSRKIALFMPRRTDFYAGLLASLARGFEAAGAQVYTGCSLLSGAALQRFCTEFRPDALFEMNRTRAMLPELPAAVRHVAWIVDTWGRPLTDLGGSEITYFFGANWLRAFPSGAGIVDLMLPGSCEYDYAYGSRPLASDFCFLGHLSKPWSAAELSRVVGEGPAGELRFGDLAAALVARWQAQDLSGFDNERYLDDARELITARTGAPAGLHDPALRHDLGCRLVRMMNRRRLLDCLPGVSDSVRIYGPGYWADWPQYAQYYQGELTDKAAMRAVYQSSALCLHEGVGPHFRAFDCMASGGLLFYLRGPDDDRAGGMNSCFTPHEHYVPFTPAEFPELAAYYLRAPKARARMAERASRHVRAQHTWRHRARRVLADLERL